MFERFTDRARRIVVLAQEECRLRRGVEITVGDLIHGLAQEGDGVAAQALRNLGVTLPRVQSVLDAIEPYGTDESRGHIPFSADCKKVLELSLREALQLGHNYIGTEHILLGVVRIGDTGERYSNLIFPSVLGIPLTAVRREVINVLGGFKGCEPPVASQEGDELDEEHPDYNPERDPSREEHITAFRERTDHFDSNSQLVAFVYLLLRDHIQPGDMEDLVSKIVPSKTYQFTNGWLGRYAEDIVNRLGG